MPSGAIKRRLAEPHYKPGPAEAMLVGNYVAMWPGFGTDSSFLM